MRTKTSEEICDLLLESGVYTIILTSTRIPFAWVNYAYNRVYTTIGVRLVIGGSMHSRSDFELFVVVWCPYEKADVHRLFCQWRSNRVMLCVVN